MKGHPRAEATGEPKFIAGLHGRVALVTGASRGIGRAVALALAKAGADVAVNYHTHADDARAACAEIERLGHRAVAVQANAAIAMEVTRMVETVQQRLGEIDIPLLAKEGITANAIAPALIGTEMVTQNPNARPDLIPLGRLGTVEEVAGVAVMLASNGYITGQTINVNGGWYMS